MKELEFKIEGKCYICGRTPETFQKDIGLTELEHALTDFTEHQRKEAEKSSEHIYSEVANLLKTILNESKSYAADLTLKEMDEQIGTLKKIYPNIEEFLKYWEIDEEANQRTRQNHTYRRVGLPYQDPNKIIYYKDESIADIQLRLQRLIGACEKKEITPELLKYQPNLKNGTYILEYLQKHQNDKMGTVQNVTGGFMRYKIERKITNKAEPVSKYRKIKRDYNSQSTYDHDPAPYPSVIVQNPEKGQYGITFLHPNLVIVRDSDCDKIEQKENDITEYPPEELTVPESMCVQVHLIVELCPLCASMYRSASNAAFNIYEEEERARQAASDD